jgi:hypothetical protein
METVVDFDSELFRPYLPDEAQVNPGRYGAELASWLSRKLADRGVMTSYPDFEDWGWFIEYATEDEKEYWLCCANRDGGNDRWRCYLEPKARSLFGRNKVPVEGAAPLMRALRELLAQEQGIRNVVWRS